MMTKERELKMQIRLNQYTTQYLALEMEKEKYYREHINDMSRTTITTLHLMQSYIDTVIRKICMLVERLIMRDINFDNEVAMMVFDYYHPAIDNDTF